MILKRIHSAFKLNLVSELSPHYGKEFGPVATKNIHFTSYFEVGRCKLDPSLKAPGFKI